MAKKPSIELKDGRVIIRNLEIEDPEVYKIISEVKENREVFVRRSLKVGAIGLRNASTIDDVDYVEKEFNQLLTKLQQHHQDTQELVENLFDIDDAESQLGKLRLLLEEYFNEKGKVTELLSPYEEGSPIKKMMDEIFKKFDELKTVITQKRTEEEVIQTTARKGVVFEELVSESLGKHCNPFGDTFEDVSNVTGTIGKTGDFVIDIDDVERYRIVLECKDSDAYSNKKTTDEIEKAIKNRDAQFGIFLFKNENQIPSALRPVKITSRFIVTSYDNHGLYYAYRIARILAQKSSGYEESSVDLSRVATEVESMTVRIQSFNNIQRKIKEIQTASKYVGEESEKIKIAIKESLERITRIIG